MSNISEYISKAVELGKINGFGLNNDTVKRNNSLAKELRALAQVIEEDGEEKQEFFDLLDHENDSVRIWCAHHILELMTYDPMTESRALNEITLRSKTNIGEKIWLDNWKKKH